MARPITIAIDGPAAAGKGTLARRLAAELGLPFLDTGLLYRAVARRVLDAGDEPANAEAASAAARALGEADVCRTDLREPEVDMVASRVAALPEVRAALLEFQRAFAANGAVLDGRDIGSVILPDASVKLFVTASVEARAGRRWRELRDRGIETSYQAVLAEVAKRDAADSTRAVAPLRPAPDAVVIDTSELDTDAVYNLAAAAVRHRLSQSE